MAGPGTGAPVLLDWRDASRDADWRTRCRLPSVFAIGVDDSDARARLLAEGVAEALPTQTGPVELATRLLKQADRGEAMPRHRRIGPVTMDLFFRDGRIGTRWLRLHPREFALLWRLADTPHSPVSRAELLADVWRLDFVPETNSLEVHISRLRAKLAVEGIGWLIITHPGGGYQLGQEGGCGFDAFSGQRRAALDSAGVIGKGAAIAMQACGDYHAMERQGFD